MVTQVGDRTFLDLRNLMDQQLELEQVMIHKGSERYHKKQRSAKEKKNESLTIYGKKLLKRSVDQYEKYLDNELNSRKSGATLIAHEYLKDIDTRTLAVIATKKIIDGISHRKKFTSFAISLGGKIEDEVYFRSFQNHNKALFETVDKDLNKRSSHYGYRRHKHLKQSQRDGFEWTHWTTKIKTHIGTLLVSLFIEATNFCTTENKILRRGASITAIKYLVPTQKIIETIKKIEDFNEYLDPEYLPTLVRPKKWKPGMSKGGGYYSQDINPIMLVSGNKITSHMNYLRDLKHADMDAVIDGINAVQSTMYKINKDILWVADTTYSNDHLNEGSTIVTSKEIDLPNKPHDIATNKESLKKWKAEATVIHGLNQKHKSKRLATAKTLYLAREFRDKDQIGFPCNLDFRSRLYYVPAFLNPQGTDLAKSLLKFAEKKPIGESGYKWLCIHLANMYGEDKISLDQRVKWTEDHKDMILECSEAPFENRSWQHADKPWQFLAACMEYSKVDQHGLGYESDLPIHIDGSCNGLQHFSALFRDQQGGYATNLTDTDLPQDIYQIVCDKVIDKLKDNDNPLAKQWLDYGIDRKATKRSVMVLPYGGTRFSCVEFIDEYLEDREDKGDKHSFENRSKACLFLAHIVWDSIGDTVIKAREAMDWLQKVARLVAKLNRPVYWETPLGFPIRQAYYDTKDLVVRTKMMGRIRIKSTTDKINKRKQASGISPNFIHSLDATAMYLTIDHARKKGINDFSMVHDSYGTHACNVELLGECTRSAFLELYQSEDPIEHLRDQLKHLLPEKDKHKIPDLPDRGDLKLDNVKLAKYFFC